MTVLRAMGMLVVFAATAISVVTLRGEQARVASRIQQLQSQRVELRRESWSLELEIGRLRGPHTISDRVGRWSLDLIGPGSPRVSPEAGETLRLAMAR